MKKTAPIPAELYTPAELEPYMSAARTAVEASNVATDPTWLSDLRAHIHGRLASAIAATKYNGIIPGSVPKPDLTTVTTAKPVAGNRFHTSYDQSVIVEGSNPDVYQASEAAKDTFAGEVDALAKKILADPQRSFEVECHFLALDQATRDKQSADVERAQHEQRTLTFTDPITGLCDPSHGIIASRPVIDQKAYDKAGTWHYVESSALTSLLIQQRLAARILTERPDLAAKIDVVVTQMMRDAGL